MHNSLVRENDFLPQTQLERTSVSVMILSASGPMPSP